MVPSAADAPTYEWPPLRGATLTLSVMANSIARRTSSSDSGMTTAAGADSPYLELKTALAAA